MDNGILEDPIIYSTPPPATLLKQNNLVLFLPITTQGSYEMSTAQD